MLRVKMQTGYQYINKYKLILVFYKVKLRFNLDSESQIYVKHRRRMTLQQTRGKDR